MASIEDQLTQLESDRQDLISNLETKGISGLSGDETFTELVPEVLNISGSVNWSEYYDNLSNGANNNSSINNAIKKLPDGLTITGTNASYLFSRMSKLKELPSIDISNVTNASSMCQYCTSLETVPSLNTSNVTTFTNMFQNCSALKNVPQFSFASAQTVRPMFGNCTSLTNDSLNNILASCVSVTNSYTDAKTLYNLFNADMSQYYPAATIQALSNYQDFIDAGWTIGW